MINKKVKKVIFFVIFGAILLNLGLIGLSKAGMLGINTGGEGEKKIQSNKDGMAFITNFIFDDIYEMQSWSIVRDKDG